MVKNNTAKEEIALMQVHGLQIFIFPYIGSKQVSQTQKCMLYLAYIHIDNTDIRKVCVVHKHSKNI